MDDCERIDKDKLRVEKFKIDLDFCLKNVD